MLRWPHPAAGLAFGCAKLRAVLLLGPCRRLSREGGVVRKRVPGTLFAGSQKATGRFFAPPGVDIEHVPLLRRVGIRYVALDVLSPRFGGDGEDDGEREDASPELRSSSGGSGQR